MNKKMIGTIVLSTLALVIAGSVSLYAGAENDRAKSIAANEIKMNKQKQKLIKEDAFSLIPINKEIGDYKGKYILESAQVGKQTLKLRFNLPRSYRELTTKTQLTLFEVTVKDEFGNEVESAAGKGEAKETGYFYEFTFFSPTAFKSNQFMATASIIGREGTGTVTEENTHILQKLEPIMVDTSK